MHRRVQGGITALQDKAARMWNGLKEKEGSIGHKVYKAGQRVVESVSPEERLMRGIPKNVQKIIIYHPTSVSKGRGRRGGHGGATAGQPGWCADGRTVRCPVVPAHVGGSGQGGCKGDGA